MIVCPVSPRRTSTRWFAWNGLRWSAMTTVPGKVIGSCVSSRRSAVTPPADAPMTAKSRRFSVCDVVLLPLAVRCGAELDRRGRVALDGAPDVLLLFGGALRPAVVGRDVDRRLPRDEVAEQGPKLVECRHGGPQVFLDDLLLPDDDFLGRVEVADA